MWAGVVHATGVPAAAVGAGVAVPAACAARVDFAPHAAKVAASDDAVWAAWVGHTPHAAEAVAPHADGSTAPHAEGAVPGWCWRATSVVQH